MRLENHCMLWIPLRWQLLGTGIHIHTWCFCLFFLSASSFCCFSNFSVALASRNPWRLVRLYAFTFIAVSRDVSLRVHDKIWNREFFFFLQFRYQVVIIDTDLQTSGTSSTHLTSELSLKIQNSEGSEFYLSLHTKIFWYGGG